MQIEERKAKIHIGDAHTNDNTKNYRVTLPTSWMQALGVDDDNRDVSLQFDGDAITIRLAIDRTYDEFVENGYRNGHDLLVLHYFDGDTLCTKMCSDRTTKQIAIENEIDDIYSTAFGVNEKPTWNDFLSFLDDRCIPRYRAGLNYYLDELGLCRYDALDIIRKTEGRMAEDNQWIRIIEEGERP